MQLQCSLSISYHRLRCRLHASVFVALICRSCCKRANKKCQQLAVCATYLWAGIKVEDVVQLQRIYAWSCLTHHHKFWISPRWNAAFWRQFSYYSIQNPSFSPLLIYDLAIPVKCKMRKIAKWNLIYDMNTVHQRETTTMRLYIWKKTVIMWLWHGNCW